MQILLSMTQAGPGRTGKQEQEQTSRNHVQTLEPISVQLFINIFVQPHFIHKKIQLIVWMYLNYTYQVQRSAKVFVRGCEKFVIALAYMFCLALVGSFLARFAYFLADLCTELG